MEIRDVNIILLVMVSCAVLIAIILLFREVVCWYLKINERIKLQKTTLDTLLKIYEQNGGEVNWDEVNKM